MAETPPIIPTNRYAIISLVAALFTVFSFCIAAAPFLPFTGWVCYPSAAVMGLVALATGITSLRQIRSNGEDGRTYALIGAWVGGLVTLASLCAATVGILLLPLVANFIHQMSK